MMKFVKKILKRVQRVFLTPIEIFVFHKVSDLYNSDYGCVEDWTQTDIFKQNILQLQKKYNFISLDSALNHLKNDVFRYKNYAVLTCDDGYRMILDILPWLKQNNIPTTIFISTQYLDGISHDPWFDALWKSKSESEIKQLRERMYIRYEDIPVLEVNNISVGLHGYGHDLVTTMSNQDFLQYIDKARIAISNKITLKPYYAYTWGKHSQITDMALREKGITPVYCDGLNNICFEGVLHRKCIDNIII